MGRELVLLIMHLANTRTNTISSNFTYPVANPDRLTDKCHFEPCYYIFIICTPVYVYTYAHRSKKKSSQTKSELGILSGGSFGMRDLVWMGFIRGFYLWGLIVMIKMNYSWRSLLVKVKQLWLY